MAHLHKLRSNRPLSSPRGDGSCFSNLFCPPPPSRTAREGLQKGKETAAMPLYYVKVENNLYTIEEPLFRDLEPHVEGASSTGSSPETPLVLSKTSAKVFEILRDAHDAEKLGATSIFQYTDLLLVGELAMRYRIRRLMKWFTFQFERVVCPPRASALDDALVPSREHSIEVFMLSTYLAVSYGRRRVVESLSSRWILHLHERSLRALPTIMFVYERGANTPQLMHLLAHACYVYLADLSIEARRLGMKAAGLLYYDFKQRRDKNRLPLPRRLYDQIRGGNHSLEKTWEKMFVNPPLGAQAATCGVHARCLDTWLQRWDVMTLRVSFLPKMDVLRKLVLLVTEFEGDDSLRHGMNSECRLNAINNLKDTRKRLSRHLHHHFDLD